MTNEERDIITQFIARVSGAQQQQQPTSGFGAGSMPATQQPALPPVDPDADQFIAQQFQRYPEARYRITQLAFVQEHALIEAQNRINRLEWELQQAQQAVQQATQQAQQAQQARPGSSGGGFFGGLFGGNRQQPAGPGPGGAAWGGPGGGAPMGGPGGAPGGPWGQQQQGYYQAAPPPPQYPPNYQQGMFQRPGGGFLGSALTTAAGVAGGMVAGNALMSLFSPHSYGGGLAGPSSMLGSSPWGSPIGSPAGGAVDTSAWGVGGTPQGPAQASQDYVDNGGWGQNSGAGDSSWATDNSSQGDSSWGAGSDSGWDDTSGGGGSDDTV